MLLTDREIHEYIESGKIGVDPFDSALVNPASLDIRLGNKYSISRPQYGNTVDPLDKDTFETFTEEHDYWYLGPQRSVLVSMYENLRLPDNVSAEIKGKSSLARLGLSNSSEAGWIDAKWLGVITMELSNHSPYTLKLTYGMKIGQLLFYKHAPVSKGYDQTGRYFLQPPGQGSLGV